MMKRANLHRSAKVIATLGPSSSSVEVISRLIKAGMSVARLNMSHGTQKGHGQLISDIRKASEQVGLEVAILLDLQGPRIRVDTLPCPLVLNEDEIWAIGPAQIKLEYPEYENRFIPTIYEGLVNDCDTGARILFDDGLIIAEVNGKEQDLLEIGIKAGGVLNSNKGINLPDSSVSAPSITEKDLEDIKFGLKNGIDYFALSFVRKKEDVIHLKDIVKDQSRDIPVVGKIENIEAIERIEEIIDVSDMIMIARGDLGVELGNHLVPAEQKKIISLCNKKGVPVITATQMIESMMTNPVPTRAEASDIANAIWDGTDAVMLSGETASGRYPVETVRMMGQIIQEAEKTPKSRMSIKDMDLGRLEDSIMIGASLIAEKIGAKRIFSVTESGSSCLTMARFRPLTSILGISNSLGVVRRMCLYWGVSPFYLDEYNEDIANFEQYVVNKARKACELEEGDMVVIARGSGKFFTGTTSNSIKVEIIK